jgi:hypothetical protein
MFDRETLEEAALLAVCACCYYDLADCLEETTNSELLDIIEGRSRCHNCR